MALYHFSVRHVSRGKGQMVVASAAYISGQRIYDGYYNKIHDYTSKSGVVFTEILTPEYVPERMTDREILWNEVEHVERKTRRSLPKTFDIVMAVFDVGSHVVTQAAASISGSTSLDVQATLTSMFNSQIDSMGIGELIGLGMETMIISLCMKIMSVLITVILYGRMIEIYLYVSVAPIPAATVTNREWGTVGTNYLKGLIALAF